LAKVHNLDIYPHTGDESCLGCVDEPDAAESSEDGAAAGGAGVTAGADDDDDAAAAGPAGGGTPGTAPAPADQPIDPSMLEVQVIGATGAPQPQVSCEVTLPDGTKRSGVTGGDGFLRLNVAPHTGTCTLVLPDVDRQRGGL
jgi:hypothetical protein